MSSVSTETETVVKRILPYMRRRGYEPESDFDFETATKDPDRYTKGYVDILVHAGKAKPVFLIEAKRTTRRLSNKDRDQALKYGKSQKVLFVIVTNGSDIQAFNVATGEALKWDGGLIGKVPSKKQLGSVAAFLKANKQATDIPLSSDSSLPFRPGLPLPKLNRLYATCHDAIRNIEKNEEHAFADFSKVLFLKLLEEKADLEDFAIPYSYRFHELAEKPASEADQVQGAVVSMLKSVAAMGYGDVLGEPLHLKKPKTFQFIVEKLAGVSFSDSGLDTKGAAFEYFVRATLKGKRLGQYFTPRPLVELMMTLVGREQITNSVLAGDKPKVLDPACGTGGFLVFAMRDSLAQLDERLKKKQITQAVHKKISAVLMQSVFHGSDANYGVASAAKMNMIVAGDGHTNIVAEDSLTEASTIWQFEEPDCDLILTNPPFGTSEKASLSNSSLEKYPVPTTKGQFLFLQRMILALKPGGYVCTVIDEGLLNNDSGAALRRWILQNADLEAVVRLPPETFKPNKINVRSSVLLLKRKDHPDEDLGESYDVTFIDVESLGYTGAGDPVRAFDFGQLLTEIRDVALGAKGAKGSQERGGSKWAAFDCPVSEIANDGTHRFDLRYWIPSPREAMDSLSFAGRPTIKDLNLVETLRGKSPSTDAYVGEDDGYALVVKAGSSLTKFGELVVSDSSDWIEKATYDEFPGTAKVKPGDVVLASTGDGTLGKAAVYQLDHPAVADTHVTVIRPDAAKVDSEYLADYLRCGTGREQIDRLFTGSTGLIELTPEHVNAILVDPLGGIAKQKAASKQLREAEALFRAGSLDIERSLVDARDDFRWGGSKS